MTNVNAIINNSIYKPLRKTIDSGILPKITSETQEFQQVEQKIYAKDLSSLGYKVSKNFTMQDKTKLDELANNYIAKFFNFLSSIESKEKRVQYLLKAINNLNYKFIEAFSIDMRTINEKIEVLKSLVGENDYAAKIRPAFQSNYKQYLKTLWEDKNISLDYLLTLRHDWSFLQVKNKMDFTKTRIFGELPKDLISEKDSENLFKYLSQIAECPKREDEVVPDLNINNVAYKIKRLLNGSNKPGAFMVENNGKKYVVKIDNIASRDEEMFACPNLQTFPSRDIFTDYYLTKNNCKNSAKLYYYKFDIENKKNISIYEYVDGDVRDISKGVSLPDLYDLKVHFKDTLNDSNVIYRNNIPVCVDTDNSSKHIPFDLYCPGYHYSIVPLSFHL